MASEAITQNDLREILSRTVGSIPSEYKKLLWTNSSPTANFAPQTISLDLSGYDDIEVVATPFADLQYQYSVICPVGAGGNLEYQILNTATATNASTFINGVSRTFRVSTSGVTFDNGQMTYNGGAYTNWQGRAIPYKIYGIKYERVAPPQVEYPNYSTEEQQVGTWIDGKPVYRKSWSGTLADGATLLTNIAHIVNFYGEANISGVYRALPYFEVYNGVGYMATVRRYTSNNVSVGFLSAGASTSADCYLTIEYTKTTD